MNADYGPDNPEPLALRDSSAVRDPEQDALHAAMEYILGHSAAELEEYQQASKVSRGDG